MLTRDPGIKSERLKRLITVKKVAAASAGGTSTQDNEDSTPKQQIDDESGIEGLMPFLDEVIVEFEMLIVWKKVSGCDD